MKPQALASTIAILVAPMVLGPAPADSQPYGDQNRAIYTPQVPNGYNPEKPGHSGWRRGERLPPELRGDIVTDYARHHLRRPPRGCFWYRDADDYVLAAAGTGLIFEVISGD